MTPPLTTTLDELERLLAALREAEATATWDDQDEARKDLCDAAEDALPALIAAARENLRPRWHHDWDLPPEDRHYCEECSALITEVRQLRAAQPAPLAEARDLIERMAEELAQEPGQKCGEYPELCVVCRLVDEARRFLDAPVASPAPLDARHLFERLAAYCNGDIEAQFQEDTGLLFDEALARFILLATPAPLDAARLARALIESDLMPRYREYAMRVPTMDPSETVEHLAAVWAGWVVAAYAAEGQAPDGL